MSRLFNQKHARCHSAAAVSGAHPPGARDQSQRPARQSRPQPRLSLEEPVMIQRRPDRPGPPISDHCCEWCQQPVDDPDRYVITVADSSYTHPHDSSRHGRRVATACCVDHAHALAQRGEREWNDDQFWAAQLTSRTAHLRTSRMTIDQLAEITQLRPEQVECALRWRGTTDALIPRQRQ